MTSPRLLPSSQSSASSSITSSKCAIRTISYCGSRETPATTHTCDTAGPSSRPNASQCDDKSCLDSQSHDRQLSGKATAVPVTGRYPTIRKSKYASLATEAPDVAATWVHEDNHGTPDDYSAGSNHLATWKCPNCEELWAARIKHRFILRSGCPHCYALRGGRKADGTRTNHPTLTANGQDQHPVMLDWDYDANEQEGLFPDEVTLRSNKLVNWVCHQCSMGRLHKFKASPRHRTVYNSSCPYCSSRKVCECNSLQTWFPEAIEEWDFNKNEGTPAD